MGKRDKGIDVKIDIGRVKIKSRWRLWVEILKEKEERGDG